MLLTALKLIYRRNRNTSISVFWLVVQSLSRVQLFVTPWTEAHQASEFFTVSQSLLNKLMSIELVSYPTISSSVVPFSFSRIRVFSNESASVAKILELQLKHHLLFWINCD
ncbi:unnamed protein product [Rangifer tarandus platyrhynchus]|uniref:Uncharacterized protein n=1 Tax=Rangifer tarandus platyrhynchus TaxID=3082113 RepID=A0AC59Z7Z1_RANTA